MNSSRKQAIAEDDLLQLKFCMSKKFKPHTEIIKRLTARTKSQITRMANLDKDGVLEGVFELSKKYGNFLKCCHYPFYEVSTTLLKIACSGLGCDHSILVNVICSSTPAELIALNKDLNADVGVDNLRKVAVGNSNEALLKKFFELALTDLSRKDSAEYITNNSVAKDEAAKLQELFATKSDDNDSAILSILVGASRAHAAHIAESYLEAAVVDLNKAIGDYFKTDSLIARALISWISPVPRAVARMVFEFGQTVSSNGNAFEMVYGVLSRYDKPMITSIAKEYEAIASANGASVTLLKDLVSACMTGKLSQAVNLWCSEEHATPDNGTEEEMVQFLANKVFHDGTDCDVDIAQIANLVKDSSTAAQMKEILQREVAHLQAYSRANIKEAPADVEVKGTTLTPEQEAGFSDARALIAAYFKVLFAYYDADNSGLLESDEFWKMVDALNLSEFGFPVEEIAQMKEVSDWDCAGKGIAYDEVINELSRSMYESCVTQGINVEELMRKRIEAHGAMVRAAAEAEAEAEAKSTVEDTEAKPEATEAEPKAVSADGEQEAKTEDAETKTEESETDPELTSPGPVRKNKLHATKKMPPHIETWIHQTFDTYDVDKGGKLDIDEFLKCVSAMNLGTTDEDLEKIRLDMDQDGDSMITWEEAIVPFTDIVLSMASDSRDHWVSQFVTFHVFYLHLSLFKNAFVIVYCFFVLYIMVRLRNYFIFRLV